MQITFLGTAAATSYPLAFCQCDFCREARIHGGKDFRKRSSIVINDDLLIDFGPDVVTASLMYNKPLTEIKYILQTHSHSDHFDASHLSTRIPEYMGVNIQPIEIVGSHGTLVKMSEMLKNEGYVDDLFNPEVQHKLNAKVTVVTPLSKYQMGAYSVLPLPTNHDVSVESLIYLVNDSKTTVLYGTDTDLIPEQSLNMLKQNGSKIDILILDQTYGWNADSGGHLNANRFLELTNRLRNDGLLSDRVRILATHISHEGNPTHNRLQEMASKFGYDVAYDGMKIYLLDNRTLCASC